MLLKRASIACTLLALLPNAALAAVNAPRHMICNEVKASLAKSTAAPRSQRCAKG